ncbi:MAG TPA: type IV secretion system DNA-binding domain-containing protein [Thermoanaerobaculia bacterium]
MEQLGGCFLIILLGIGAVYLFGYLIRERRKAEHEEIMARITTRAEEKSAGEETRRLTAEWLRFKESFPYLPKPRAEDLSAEAIADAVREAISGFPSHATLDAPSIPVPFPPQKERRRHLYVAGKTGSGKSTLLEHLIVEDFEEERGVAVIGPEGELFTRLLTLLPSHRYGDLIYFAPANPACPHAFNPLEVEADEDPARAAEDLFTIFRRALADDELGPRMQPIIQNAFAALVGRPGATLWDVKRLLTDALFRDEVALAARDPYVREFWRETYPRFPKGSDLPIMNRLDAFLRPPAVRRALCQFCSTFSVREVLETGEILLLDLYGLSEEAKLVIGQSVLAKFQLELMRRELAGSSSPQTFYLYCDELQAVAGTAEGLWRQLLSRGRKYGLAVSAATQFPAQLPTALQNEIFGNVGSLVAFALGNKDAQVIRKELLAVSRKKDRKVVEPLEASELIELPVGTAYGKFAGGRAVKIRVNPPRKAGTRRAAEEAMRNDWIKYGEPVPDMPEPSVPPSQSAAREPESFLE